MEIYDKLANIQSELEVPKKHFNSFGNYNYRNAEDILDAVKPLCIKYKAVLTISDTIVERGGRIYVMAVASLNNLESDNKIYVTSYAREEEEKKGMSESQITGSASSYARKYALNGLFCIDDVKDSDSHDNSSKTVNKPKPASQPQQGEHKPQGEKLPDFETIKQELASMGQEEQGVYRDRLLGLCVSDKQKSAMLKVCFGEKQTATDDKTQTVNIGGGATQTYRPRI